MNISIFLQLKLKRYFHSIIMLDKHYKYIQFY